MLRTAAEGADRTGLRHPEIVFFIECPFHISGKPQRIFDVFDDPGNVQRLRFCHYRPFECGFRHWNLHETAIAPHRHFLLGSLLPAVQTRGDICAPALPPDDVFGRNHRPVYDGPAVSPCRVDDGSPFVSADRID